MSSNQSKVVNTFEGIESLGKSAGVQVKQVVSDVADDVKESMGLEVAEKQQIKKTEQVKMNQIRQNLAQINQQMAEARKKREGLQQQKVGEQVQKVEKKEETFKQKKKESVIQKLLRSQSGTKEGVQRASG